VENGGDVKSGRSVVLVIESNIPRQLAAGSQQGD